MSLRMRIAGVAGLAVALAVLAAAIGLYLAVRSDLRGQIDESLNQRAQAFVAAAPLLSGARRSGAGGSRTGGSGKSAGSSGATGSGSGGSAGAAAAAGSQASPPDGGFPDGGLPAVLRARGGKVQGPLPKAVQPARFGAATGYVQFVSAAGVVDAPRGQGSTPEIPPNAREKQIAASGRGRSLSDRTVKGTDLRVLTLGTSDVAGSPRGAVMIARPLTEVDHELSRILLILLVVGLAGIALAAVLGAFVARTALAPIARFTRRTESLAGELNLSERLESGGDDELGRLATSFNTTLDALERSLAAQRQLVADASHELRTPIASLRANIQTLEDAERLPPAEQARLREDIVDELDELTALVGDVVELARGSRAPSELQDVRLDEIVADAVARTRRRAELNFVLELQPTIVRGEAERINRAVSNLLDNARKWSPPGGAVEVSVHDGALTVRDHGPGFEQDELGKVFERFYRAERARKQPGSGLGLAIVRQAAEAHRGYARARNAPGGGACLEVSFGPALGVRHDAEPLAASARR